MSTFGVLRYSDFWLLTSGFLAVASLLVASGAFPLSPLPEPAEVFAVAAEGFLA